MGQTTRVSIGSGRYRTDIQAGAHELVADEPAGAGGTDEGPDPYSLLLGALGACTAITLRMYADRKQWPLEGVEIELSHERAHASDCEDCASREGMVSVIHRRIGLLGDLDDEQRGRLMDIADKCPVHKTLEGEVRIRTAPIN
jgi:putative redox protein